MRLSFERIMSLTNKVSLYLQYKYGLDSLLGAEKALDVWVENKEYIEEMLSKEEVSLTSLERELYFYFHDKVRQKCGIFQIRKSNGDRVWYSPYLHEEIYDTTDDNYASLESLEDVTQKEIYYQHKDAFELSDKGYLFIDLVFSGYNPTNEVDVLVFKEALGTDSVKYVKTFFNRLCFKLEEKSKEIGLR